MRNSTADKIDFTLVLIRHGKTAGNLEKRYIGKTDEPLCKKGIEELQSNAVEGKYPDCEVLFASPMKRCVETLEICWPGLDFQLIEEFKEIDFGDFEGKNHAELNGRADYQNWIDSNGTLPFPGGESQEDFVKRCRAGFDKIIELVKKNEALAAKALDGMLTVGAVVHGGTIMALLSSFAEGQYFDYMIGNGEGYSCKVHLCSGKISIDSVRKL